MPDSLLFDGVDDEITLALGGTNFAFGPGTIAAIVKRDTSTSYDMAVAVGSATVGYAMWIAITNHFLVLQCDGNAPTAITITVVPADGWVLIAVTKATGTVTFRAHRYVFSTQTWTHEDSAATLANSSVPSGTAYIGRRADGHYWAGNILIAGVTNTVLSDAAIETLITKQAWIDAGFKEGWRCNEMSGIASFGTVGDADESSRTGTTVDTDDVPPDWVDSDFGLWLPSRVPLRGRRGG